MSNTNNIWAVEALTELAAYELAFPEKNRERPISSGVSSQEPYYTFDEVHEYSMSCFLRYLLWETNSAFEDLWISVASSGKTNLGVCINDFFKSRSSDFISLDVSYLNFWRDTISDSDAPLNEEPDSLFYKRKMYFQANQHSAEFEYKDIISTTALNLFTVKGYAENMPLRIFDVECTGVRAMCAQVPGILYANEINTARTPDGYNWDSIYTDPTLGDSHRLYQFEQGKDSVVLVALECMQSDVLYGVKVSEIQAQCNPKKIDSIVPGHVQEFQLAFKDIFTYVGEVEVVIDFGDGEVRRYKKTNGNGTLNGTITHTFGEITGNTVTCSLYDVTQGNKALISRLVIPIAKGEAVLLSATPNSAEPGSAVRLSTNINESGYTYQWEFGDGTSDTTNSIAQISHIYETSGTYTASVTVLDSEGKRYGMALVSVTIQSPEPTTEEDHYSWLYGTWQYTSETFYNVPTHQTWYWIETLQLNSDGTFHYEFAPIVIDVPEDEQPTYDSISNNIYEYAADNGTMQIFKEGGSPSDAFGYLFFDDGSYDGNLYLDDDTLIFNGSIFSKIE